MLDAYLQRTQLLLKDPDFDFFNEGDLTTYINIARGQIAGEAECVRVYTTLAVDSSTQQYAFSLINLAALTASITGVLHVRQASVAVASGQAALHSRSFPWFNAYVLCQSAPTAGPPTVWSQFGQGASGTLFVNLLDKAYTLSLDTVCYPINLTDDTTTEALPYQWTDAVPWYAAYFAAVTAGNADAAEKYWNEYQKFVQRARLAATPSVLPGNFAQAMDPFAQNRLALQPRNGGPG